MTLILADRVKETTTTTGTGTISLAGASSGFQTFVAAIGSGNTTYYAVTDANGTAWEVGIGTVNDASPDTLARTTVLSSSTGSKISLSSGTHVVFATYPAGKAVILDANGKTDLTFSKAPAIPYTTITDDTTLTDANVVVFADAEHLCMKMRGVRNDATLSSFAFRGIYENKEEKEHIVELIRKRASNSSL